MSSTDVTGRTSPPAVTPHYGSTVPNPSDAPGGRGTKCVTGLGFFKTVQGILNIVIIIAIVCILISAGVSNAQNCKDADNSSWPTSAKVSAYSTRGAVLAFAVIGLILILVDTLLHVTSLINRLPATFDMIFIIIMIVLAGIYFILGCCAAAWETKMKQTVGHPGGVGYMHPGSAAAASFFLFVAMLAILADFILRIIRPAPPNNTT